MATARPSLGNSKIRNWIKKSTEDTATLNAAPVSVSSAHEESIDGILRFVATANGKIDKTALALKNINDDAQKFIATINGLSSGTEKTSKKRKHSKKQLQRKLDRVSKLLKTISGRTKTGLSSLKQLQEHLQEHAEELPKKIGFERAALLQSQRSLVRARAFSNGVEPFVVTLHQQLQQPSRQRAVDDSVGQRIHKVGIPPAVTGPPTD